MKLCWDNIENIRLNRRGNFFDTVKNRVYYLVSCRECHKEYLIEKRVKSFRCQSCAQSGVNNPMYGKTGKLNHFYGKHHTEETKKNWSKKRKGKYKGKDNSFYGKHHTEESKKKISEKIKGRYIGEESYRWDGGYNSNGIPKYDTYAPQLDWCEEVRCNADDSNVLEVRCTYCGKWYIPKIWQVKNRIGSLKDSYNGENRFYCSENCKHACPIYNKKPETLIKEDAVRAGKMPWLELDREVQRELRQMVLERDGYVCQKCGSTENLHCHHILPVAIEPLLSADIDNCITLCEKCHKAVHKLPGCGYNEISIC